VLDQGRVESRQAEAHIQRVRQFPTEHVAGMPIEDGDQVEEALGHGDVGNVGAPYFIRGGGRPVSKQVRIARDTLPRY